MRFILIDRLLELETARRAVAQKTFAPGEKLFEDHFPGFPVVPGVLLTEAMVQTGGWLILRTLDFSMWPFLCLIDKAKFRRFVAPGETLRIEANVCSIQEDNFEIKASTQVDQLQVAEARVFYRALPASTGAMGGAFEFEKWARETFEQLGGESVVSPGSRAANGAEAPSL